MTDPSLPLSAESHRLNVDGLPFRPWLPRVAIWIGLLSSLVGAVDGIVMLARRTLVECPNLTFTPEGADAASCFDHPHLASGLAVLAVSVSLAALFVLLGAIFSAVVSRS